MSKILDVQATKWTREDLPGFHVRYTLPDDAKVTLDDAPVNAAPATNAKAPATAAGAAIASNQGGYVSEVAQAVLGRWSADAQGRLVDGNGKVITEPENTDPLPNDFGSGTVDEQVAVLLQWQFDHPYFGNQINIDGNDLGQPGGKPKAMFSTAGGKLRLRTDAPVPAPVPVTVLPPPSAADYDINVQIGAERQKLIRTDKFGSGVLRLHLTAPNIANPTSPGFIRIAEKPGSEVHNGQLAMSFAGTRFVAEGIDPSIGWSTKDGSSVDVVVSPGTPFTVEYRHTDAMSTLAPNDVIVDVRNPA